MSNVFIGAVKNSVVEKKQQLKKLEAKLEGYFKQFTKLEAIYERTEKYSDLRKIEALQDKISTVTGKIENLQDQIPFYMR